MIIKRYPRCIIAAEEDQGIVIPKDSSTNLDQFIDEVRDVALKEFRHVRLVSLVYDSRFKRNYDPLKEFLKRRTSWDFENDETIKELYSFFFSHVTKNIDNNGNVEFNFNI